MPLRRFNARLWESTKISTKKRIAEGLNHMLRPMQLYGAEKIDFVPWVRDCQYVKFLNPKDSAKEIIFRRNYWGLNWFHCVGSCVSFYCFVIATNDENNVLQKLETRDNKEENKKSEILLRLEGLDNKMDKIGADLAKERKEREHLRAEFLKEREEREELGKKSKGWVFW